MLPIDLDHKRMVQKMGGGGGVGGVLFDQKDCWGDGRELDGQELTGFAKRVERMLQIYFTFKISMFYFSEKQSFKDNVLLTSLNQVLLCCLVTMVITN